MILKEAHRARRRAPWLCIAALTLASCGAGSGREMPETIDDVAVGTGSDDAAAAAPLPASAAAAPPMLPAPLDDAAIPSRDSIGAASAEPGLPFTDGVVLLDAALGTWQVQASSSDRFGVAPGRATHFYSRRQPWNADESRLLIADRWVDAIRLEPVGEPLFVSSSRSWSHADPDRLLAIAYPDGVVPELVWWNVAGDDFERVLRFDGLSACRFGGGEGSLSVDDRWIVVGCERDDAQRALMVVDVRDRLIRAMRIADAAYNWSSVSPSGRFVLVENTAPGSYDGELLRFDLDWSQRTLLAERPAHGDICTDPDGEELFVMIDGERLRAVRLADGLSILSDEMAFDAPPGFGHVSCRNVRRPGWAYLSADGAGWVAAASLRHDGGPRSSVEQQRAPARFERRFEYWADHRSTASDYAAQPKVAVSPSGRQIVFTTDLLGASETVDVVVTPRSEPADWFACLDSGRDEARCSR